MGCDIHFFVEKWTNTNDYDGPVDISEKRINSIDDVIGIKEQNYRWVSADKWVFNGDWAPGEFYVEDQLYKDRNYSLFGLLAGVRVNDPTIAIYPRRGRPKDASFGLQYLFNIWEGDLHSTSYLTLAELLENIDKFKPYPDFIETIENMKKIDPDPNMVRCVFFFDN